MDVDEFWALIERGRDTGGNAYLIQPSDPTGEELDFDDDEQMCQRLPRLFALFAEEG